MTPGNQNVKMLLIVMFLIRDLKKISPSHVFTTCSVTHGFIAAEEIPVINSLKVGSQTHSFCAALTYIYVQTNVAGL